MEGHALTHDVMPARLLDPIAVAAYTEKGQCAECRWPEVCDRDGTCWHAERQVGQLWPTPRIVRPAKVKPAAFTREQIVSAIQHHAERDGAPPRYSEWIHVDPDRRRPSVDQVLDVFGTWNAAIEAAGFSARRGGRSNFQEHAA